MSESGAAATRLPNWLRLLRFWLYKLPLLILVQQLRSVWAWLRACCPDAWLPKKCIAGQRVLITGAANGVGRLVACELAGLGAELYLLDVDKAGLQRTRDDIRSRRGTARCWQCDLADYEQVQSVMTDVMKAADNFIDIVVLNAGIVNGDRMENLSRQQIDKLFTVNVTSQFWLLRHVQPGWYAAGRGHLVSMASVCGLWSVPRLTDYCCSKAAAIGLAEAVHTEMHAFGCKGLKTTVINPYYINTGMFDGCTTKYPELFPILQPAYVCRKVVDAILIEKERLILPRMFWFFYQFERTQPRETTRETAEFFGLHSGIHRMKDATDRKRVL